MVDTLAFLKNDYTEDEAKKLLVKISPLCEELDTDYTLLLRTTQDIKVQELIEEVCMKAGKHHYDFLCEYGDVIGNEKYEQYLHEIGAYRFLDIPKGKYVILTRISIGAGRFFENLLISQSIPFISIAQWYGNEFAKEDFEEII